MGIVLGAFGYRYWEENGGRLPILEQMTGRSTEELMGQATSTMEAAKRKATKATNEAVGAASRQTAMAAEDIS
jgi:hypothetical protein